MKTTYEIAWPQQIADKNIKPFKSLTAIHKFLQENAKEIKKAKGAFGLTSLTCSWIEEDVKRPKGMFNPFKIGYREFTLENDGSMSYNKRPLHEF